MDPSTTFRCRAVTGPIANKRIVEDFGSHGPITVDSAASSGGCGRLVEEQAISNNQRPGLSEAGDSTAARVHALSNVPDQQVDRERCSRRGLGRRWNLLLRTVRAVDYWKSPVLQPSGHNHQRRRRNLL